MWRHYDRETMRLHDYLRRLGVVPPLDAGIDTLRRLHLAHREAFLFETLTIQTGGTIRLDLDALERKFLDEGRGGYCFEQNTLFAAVLNELGFPLVSLLGRVRRGPADRWMRTHMVLVVDIQGSPWLADVGFGAIGLIEPMPLRDGESSTQGGFTYALRREEGKWILSVREAARVTDLYEFTEDPQTSGDVEVANHYTSTHPDSIFRRTLTIQRSGRAERTVLRGEILARYRDGEVAEQPVAPDALRDTAREVFGVELPATPLVCEETKEHV